MTSEPGALAQNDPQAPEHAARNRMVIGLLLVATFVVILNETIMSVALPRLMDDLGATANAVQWLTTAFLLTMAVVIPVTGFLIQRTNTRPLFILAMGLFSLGTLAAALSPSLAFMIAARVVQALGTAIMMPLLMTTVMTLVPHNRRGPVMGNISMVISVAPAIGPAISGIVLNYLSWPWLFWLVLPIALTALGVGARLMSNVTTPRYAPLDILSVPISALAFGGLVYGLSSFGELGGEDGNTTGYVAVAVGVLAMAVFVLRQIRLQKTERALLDLRTFTSKNFTISLAMMVIMMAALFGTVILLPIYMQNVLGFDTLRTGALLLPGGLVMGLLAPRVGRLYETYGPRPLIVPGSAIVCAVLWAMTLLGPDTNWVNILIGHILISIGLALTFTPLFTVSLSSVPAELYSHGSATLGSVQQVAGAAGVALFIAIMSAISARHTAEGLDPVLALSKGITAAFTVGAILSIFTIVSAFFVRRPPDFGAPQMVH
ncbi:DHA2 family efflux MFS transporter permease subunit [Loktanella sp. IMCC34160]|uniref:MDR family MFS transporter n=1 Tax=Loktanella sp. IMCC34160 TaxID=2510646 RepID=UPI00101C462D|nr:MDR family MFS transporter [Loktanella sp. IMCC34160]RYG92280.1 DHA2 family efflux MFS transporter permease subunit [Loktanella sp. IMCC34160]